MFSINKLTVLWLLLVLGLGPGAISAAAETKKRSDPAIPFINNPLKTDSISTKWTQPKEKGIFYVCPDGLIKVEDVGSNIKPLHSMRPKEIMQLMKDGLLDYHFITGPAGMGRDFRLATLIMHEQDLRSPNFLAKTALGKRLLALIGYRSKYHLESASYYGRGSNKRILLTLTNQIGKSVQLSPPRRSRSDDRLLFDNEGKRVGDDINAPKSMWGYSLTTCAGNKTIIVRSVDVFYSFSYDQFGAEVPYPLMIRVIDRKTPLLEESPYIDQTPSFY